MKTNTKKVSRDQLKEIIRKVYLKNIINEDHLEEYKTIISSKLSNFFANEKNLNLAEEYIDGQPIISVFPDIDKIQLLFREIASQVDGSIEIVITLKNRRI